MWSFNTMNRCPSNDDSTQHWLIEVNKDLISLATFMLSATHKASIIKHWAFYDKKKTSKNTASYLKVWWVWVTVLKSRKSNEKYDPIRKDFVRDTKGLWNLHLWAENIIFRIC